MTRNSPVAIGAPILQGRARVVTAMALVTGPIVMTVGFFFAYLAWRDAAAGAKEIDVTLAQPTLWSLTTMLDFLSACTFVAMNVAFFIVTRRWSAKLAWTGAIAMTLQTVALGAVAGAEILVAGLAAKGVDPAILDKALDSFSTQPGGFAIFILFLPVEVVGMVAMGLALWRTRWVPRVSAVIVGLFPFVDILVPGHLLRVGVFVVYTVAWALIAGAVMRTGAPKPARSVKNPVEQVDAAQPQGEQTVSL